MSHLLQDECSCISCQLSVSRKVSLCQLHYNNVEKVMIVKFIQVSDEAPMRELSI